MYHHISSQSFENLAPRAGEEKRYSTGVSYCHIAFLPNLGRAGNIPAIAGTEVEGTEGGGEFVTSEQSMAQLRTVAVPGSDGRLPYFEGAAASAELRPASTSWLCACFGRDSQSRPPLRH